MNPVKPILSSGQNICNNSHSLLAVSKLADVGLQVEWATLVRGKASQVSLWIQVLLKVRSRSIFRT